MAQQIKPGQASMALVAEADYEGEEGEDDVYVNRQEERLKRVISHDVDSQSVGKNDVSCFLDLLNGDNNSNDGEEQMLPNQASQFQSNNDNNM